MWKFPNMLGIDNVFIFGLTAAQVAERRKAGHVPRDIVDHSPHLKQVIESIRTGVFSPSEPNRYHDLIRGLLDHDYFLVTADFAAYSEALGKADAVWRDKAHSWTKKAVHNTARLGWFSADRTIRDYARDIWNIPTA